MKTRSWLVLLSVLLGAAALGVLPPVRVASADGAACGAKDNPCPLQRWMRDNMGPAMAAGDLPALAKALDHAAGLSPDASWTWSSIAKTGADAARKGDLAATKASCKSCHEAYKEKYKTQFRTRPVN